MTLRLVLPGGGGGGASPANLPGEANFLIDGLGAPIAVGQKGDIEMDFNGLWQSVTLLADQVCNAQVDLWQIPYAAYPPAAAASIVGTNPPRLVAALKYQDLNLATWTPAFGPHSALRFVVVANDVATRLTVALRFIRT